MKISKKYLRRLIKEELTHLSEGVVRLRFLHKQKIDDYVWRATSDSGGGGQHEITTPDGEEWVKKDSELVKVHRSGDYNPADDIDEIHAAMKSHRDTGEFPEGWTKR